MFEPDDEWDEADEELENPEEEFEEETLEELAVDEDGHVRPRKRRKDDEADEAEAPYDASADEGSYYD